MLGVLYRFAIPATYFEMLISVTFTTVNRHFYSAQFLGALSRDYEIDQVLSDLDRDSRHDVG